MHADASHTIGPAPVTAHPSRLQRQLRAIHRLREALFELQCAPDPDPVAIDGLMHRLARVRSRSVGALAAAA